MIKEEVYWICMDGGILNIKNIGLAIVVGLGLVLAWSFTFGKTKYYPTQNECVQKTGKACAWKACDFNCKWGTEGRGWLPVK